MSLMSLMKETMEEEGGHTFCNFFFFCAILLLLFSSFLNAINNDDDKNNEKLAATSIKKCKLLPPKNSIPLSLIFCSRLFSLFLSVSTLPSLFFSCLFLFLRFSLHRRHKKINLKKKIGGLSSLKLF